MSVARTEILRSIESCGIVGIIRIKDGSKLPRVVEALAEGGVRVLEITMTVPGAIDLIKQTAATLPEGFVLGAGTVLEPETARRVIDAGARFLVSPVFRADLVKISHDRGVPILPGCFTPSEILHAWEMGADIIKVFPATALGPGYLRDVHAPLPTIKMMPTGGVTIDNAGEWIRAGAVAVGVGSALINSAVVDAGDFKRLAADSRKIVANVAAARTAMATETQ